MRIRSRIGLAALAGIAAVAGGCAPDPAPAPPRDTAPAIWVDSAGVIDPATDPAGISALDRFIAAGPRITARTRADLARLLGAPDSTHAEPVSNRHVPGQIDSLVTVHYPSVSASTYAVTGGNDILTGITIRDNRWLRDGPVRIGAAWERVRERWGEPASADAEGYHFACRTCVVEEGVSVVVAGGRVVALRFTHYVD